MSLNVSYKGSKLLIRINFGGLGISGFNKEHHLNRPGAYRVSQIAYFTETRSRCAQARVRISGYGSHNCKANR